jgi:anti-sigma regulatory factor (Ser/Thr protein kinase)
MCNKAETTVSCTPASVEWTRRWVSAELTAMYRRTGEVAFDVQVVVSEIVTNAIRAQCSRLALVIEAHRKYVRIAVTDDAPGTPMKQTLSASQAHGRGLLVVDALASRWGVDVAEHDKTVWVEVAVSADQEPTFACAI